MPHHKQNKKKIKSKQKKKEQQTKSHCIYKANAIMVNYFNG